MNTRAPSFYGGKAQVNRNYRSHCETGSDTANTPGKSGIGLRDNPFPEA